MVRSQVVSALGAALITVALAGAPTAAVGESGDSALQTPQEIQHPDRELVAKANGWTLSEAAAQEHAGEVVGAIATRIAATRPEIFVGSALSEVPGAAPTLYVKGPADGFVRDLVSASDIDIILADEQPYSLEELKARSHRVHLALAAAGFRNIVTGANITGGGLIPAAVAVEPGLPTATSVILTSIPSDLRGSVVLSVEDPSGFRDTTAFGGMWVTLGTANWCTSGWAVRYWDGSDYVYGVTTAGHCENLNGIRHGSTIHSFPEQWEHRGEYGDVEWHTSNVAVEATFYATSSVIRPALYLEPIADISVNEVVCQYGRASNYRDCDLHVYDTSIECTLNDHYNNNLVQMNAITSAKGDSGGGWSYDYTAYGSQKGWCNSRDAWSVADLYDEALGVEFVIYE